MKEKSMTSRIFFCHYKCTLTSMYTSRFVWKYVFIRDGAFDAYDTSEYILSRS